MKYDKQELVDLDKRLKQANKELADIERDDSEEPGEMSPQEDELLKKDQKFDQISSLIDSMYEPSNSNPPDVFMPNGSFKTSPRLAHSVVRDSDVFIPIDVHEGNSNSFLETPQTKRQKPLARYSS